tara:strand:- start:457 stop:795 length:339 start_codon:yes stop_codon:yes gene_type:complete
MGDLENSYVLYNKLDKTAKARVASKVWIYMNLSYTNGSDIMKTPMSFWTAQIDKILDEYDLTLPNGIIQTPHMTRSIFDILYKDMGHFTRGDKIGKVYSYDIVNSPYVCEFD